MNKEEIKKRVEALDSKTRDITQNKVTEAPFTGKYLDEHSDGSYHCIVCGQKLFESDAKFDSGSGWPSFDQAVPGSVKMIPDNSGGMNRTEVVCSQCGSHLGHLFEDGPKETTGQRFCINSASLDLKK
ncbi:MAG: peptide-methionine (R)-S-oxide reductase MsrB [Candidatus Saccharibacteria bacterium]